MADPTFWLSRDGKARGEGPYSKAQLQAMYGQGTITAAATVCAKGAQVWQSVDELLSADQAQQNLARMKAAHRSAARAYDPEEHDAKTAAQCFRAGEILVGLTCALAFIPYVGLLAWVAYGITALVVLVLAIIVMVKGQAGRGIIMLGASWLCVPVAITVGNIVGTGIAVAYQSDRMQQAKDEAAERAADTERWAQAKGEAAVMKVLQTFEDGALCLIEGETDPVLVADLRNMAEGARYQGMIYPAGTFSYRTALGQPNTVRRYATQPAQALRLAGLLK